MCCECWVSWLDWSVIRTGTSVISTEWAQSSSGKVQTFRCAQERSEPCPHRRRGPVSQLPSVTRGTYFILFPKERTKKCFSVRTLKRAPISQINQTSNIYCYFRIESRYAPLAPAQWPGPCAGLAACVRPARDTRGPTSSPGGGWANTNDCQPEIIPAPIIQGSRQIKMFIYFCAWLLFYTCFEDIEIYILNAF